MNMAIGARYRVSFRRKRAGKTDYRQRVKLLLSGVPRLVVRGGSKNITAQLVSYSPEGDEVLASAHSRELGKYGWKGAGSNIPASYLVGLLCGKRALEKGQGKAIFDLGFQAPMKGGRIFAALKGAIDAGIEVPHSEDALPREERIRGEHISKYAGLLKDKSKKVFSDYFRRKLDPTELPEHFEKVRKKIVTSKGK